MLSDKTTLVIFLGAVIATGVYLMHRRGSDRTMFRILVSMAFIAGAVFSVAFYAAVIALTNSPLGNLATPTQWVWGITWYCALLIVGAVLGYLWADSQSHTEITMAKVLEVTLMLAAGSMFGPMFDTYILTDGVFGENATVVIIFGCIILPWIAGAISYKRWQWKIRKEWAPGY